MATQLQIRRGTNTQNGAFTGAEGELSANTTNDSVHVHDGSTAGGFELARADFGNISTSATLTIATLNTTNLDLTNLEVTNLKAKDGTAAGSIADSTGVVTLISSALTTADITTLKIGGTTVTSTAAELNYVDGVTSAIQTQIDAKAPTASPTFTGTVTIPTADINGGSIDGSIIGGSSAAAGSFTTGSFSGLLQVTQTPSDTPGNVGISLKDVANAIEFGLRLDATSKDLHIDRYFSGGWHSQMTFDRSTGGIDVTGSVTADGLTSSTNIETTGSASKFVSNSSSSGDYIRLYAGSGTGKWDIYGNGANLRIGDNDSAGAVTIDTNVGIGTTGPNSYSNQTVLTINGTNFGRVDLEANGTLKGSVFGGGDGLNLDAGANQLVMFAGGSEAGRFDASRNFLVGTSNTGANHASDGAYITASGQIIGRATGIVSYLNRRGSDGQILQFMRDGISTGSIACNSDTSNAYMIIGKGSVGTQYASDSEANSILPARPDNQSLRDAGIDLGAAGTRFKDLYLSGGVFLGGTAAANKLDDAEEGTWTPALVNAGSPSYSTQYGRYTKIGRVVYCSIAVRATNVSGSSNIELSGLPFAPADASDALQRSTYAPRNGGHCSGLTTDSGRFRILTSTNMAGVKGDTSTSFMTAAQFSSGGSPQFTGDFWYYTS